MLNISLNKLKVFYSRDARETHSASRRGTQLFRDPQGEARENPLFSFLFFIEILLKSSTDPNDTEIHPSEISKLVDMGFTDRQAQIALKRTRLEK
jgi:hypothetical protein